MGSLSAAAEGSWIGFRDCGFGFGVWGLGFRVCGLGFRTEAPDPQSPAPGLRRVGPATTFSHYEMVGSEKATWRVGVGSERDPDWGYGNYRSLTLNPKP